MFNEFEGNADERQAKLDERLTMLKRAREAGFFGEEGTESADIVVGGVNPCDPNPSLIFTGEGLEPEFKKPMSVIEAERKRCWKCRGVGDLPIYGGELERCPMCSGTGRNDTPPCIVCAGQGHDIRGQTCLNCNGRGIEPTQ